uniref:Uncharacterized protein n=1 Tax=Arundo donax TaxID=35708 RepID=A0A0A9F7U9_ARUDO
MLNIREPNTCVFLTRDTVSTSDTDSGV